MTNNTITLSIERDEPLCGEGESDNTHEYTVEVEMDCGSVHAAVIVDRFDSHTEPTPVARQPVELTKSEQRRAERDWLDVEIACDAAARDRHDADAFDRAGDR